MGQGRVSEKGDLAKGAPGSAKKTVLSRSELESIEEHPVWTQMGAREGGLPK